MTDGLEWYEGFPNQSLEAFLCTYGKILIWKSQLLIASPKR